MLRYGWTQQAAPPRSPPRNWTSLDLAKPLWEEVMENKFQLKGHSQLLLKGRGQGWWNQSERLQARAGPAAGYGRGRSSFDKRRNYQFCLKVGAPGGGKETYGTWDQSLNLLPAMSRSTEPRPKQWILLARSRYNRSFGSFGINRI